MHWFVRRRRVLFFRTENVQTTPVDSKLKFVRVSYGLVTVKKGQENGPVDALNALVRAPKVRLVFSHRTFSNHPGGLQTQVCTYSLCFGRPRKRHKN